MKNGLIQYNSLLNHPNLSKEEVVIVTIYITVYRKRYTDVILKIQNQGHKYLGE